jgi:ATP-dependent protease ClpP protease subunit
MTIAIPLQSIQIQQQNFINSLDHTIKKYNVFLDSEIGEPSEYRELLTILFNAPPDSLIYLYINCTGGNLDTTLAIVEAIKTCDAKVSAILIGSCHSAASIIALNCDEIIVLDNAYSMVHTASFGSSGNVGTVKSHTEFVIAQIDKLIENTYSGFLNKEELARVKNGNELWFNAEDIRKRLKRKFKHINKKLKTN